MLFPGKRGVSVASRAIARDPHGSDARSLRQLLRNYEACLRGVQVLYEDEESCVKARREFLEAYDALVLETVMVLERQAERCGCTCACSKCV